MSSGVSVAPLIWRVAIRSAQTGGGGKALVRPPLHPVKSQYLKDTRRSSTHLPNQNEVKWSLP